MADGLVQEIRNVNMKKRFVQSIAFTTSSSNTTLNAITDATVDDGTNIPKGAMWVFQPTQDCNYVLANKNVTATLSNSITIPQNFQEYCEAKDTDGSTTPASTTGGTRPILSLIGVAASGTMKVFAVY